MSGGGLMSDTTSFILAVAVLGVIAVLVIVSISTRDRARIFEDEERPDPGTTSATKPTLKETYEQTASPPRSSTPSRSGRFVVFGLVLSLAANVVLAGVLVNHRNWIAELEDVKADQDKVHDLAIDTATLEQKVEAQEPFDASALERRLSGVETSMRLLRGDVRFVNGSVDRILGFLGTSGGTLSAEVDASDIDVPVFCRSGDYAVWDYIEGLTC